MSRIRADQLVNRVGSGGPKFPNGVADGFSVSGVVTATSFRGDGSQLTGIDASSLKDGSDVKIQATNTGATVTGVLVANVTGNVTGNVTSSGANTLGSLTVSNDATFSGNATVSGNLSVQGTTTTIDTAVTSVDSLQVDTKVAIGTDTYDTSDTVLQVNKTTSHAEVNIRSGNAHGALINFSDVDTHGRGRIKYNHADDSLSFRTSATDRFIIDGNGTSKFKGPLTEKCNRDTGAGLTGNYNHDLISHGNVHWATSNSVGTWTYNLRGNASVALNDMMIDGETLSFQLISAQNNASYYMTQFRIDGTAHTVWWQGGSAPSAGGSGGYDVYTFTVFKIGNASFRTFASLTNHA